MKWDTIQQLIRILAYLGGGYFFGEAITTGEQFQSAVAGLSAVVAFGWWAANEWKKSEK